MTRLEQQANTYWTAASCIRGQLNRPMSLDTAEAAIKSLSENCKHEGLRRLACAARYEFREAESPLVWPTPLDLALAAVKGFGDGGRPCDVGDEG